MAERVGFEPTEACTSAVFKTVALNHSATSPLEHYYKINRKPRQEALCQMRLRGCQRLFFQLECLRLHSLQLGACLPVKSIIVGKL